MYPPEAIDFERPYVSPYLRRRCRSLAEVEAAHRDGAAAWKDTSRLSLLHCCEDPSGSEPVLKPGPLHHHAQPKGGE